MMLFPYSDLMDFFYVWLRRTLHGLSHEIDQAFAEPLAPKWNHDANDGELIDDACRFNGDKAASKQNYEDGMARAFRACHAALKPDGRLVVVFAHKQPDAWETLVSAMIKAGFVVTASWPIQTEKWRIARALIFGGARLLYLDGLQKAPGHGQRRMGKCRPDRNARPHHPETARLLGRRHSRPGFRLGGHRPGAGSLQPIPGGQKSEGGSS